MGNMQENEEPKAGEWWFIPNGPKGGEDSVIKAKIVVQSKESYILDCKGHTPRFFTRGRKDLLGRVPHRFPRLRRFFSFFQKK